MMEQIRVELGFVGVISLSGPMPNEGGSLFMALWIRFFLCIQA